MSWAEVKYAINDTLGTNDFQSLNKIIVNSKNIVAEAESPVFYPTLKHSELSGLQEETSLAEYKMFIGGSFFLNLKTIITKTATSSGYHPTLRIYVNESLNQEIAIASFTNSQTSSGREYETNSNRILVSHGNNVKITFLTNDATVADSSRCKFEEMSVNGKIIDTVAFNV